MHIITKWLELIARCFGVLAILFLLFMMLGTTADVVVRSVHGKPISGVFEMSELSMVLVVFLGLGWTQQDDAHIRVTMLVDRLPPAWRSAINGMALALAALLLAILAYPATEDAIHSFAIREFRWGHIAFPIWWAKIALALGLWFACLQMLVFSVLRFLGQGAGQTAPSVGDLRHG